MKKILVRTCSHLGDYVILSGAVRHFRATYPDYTFANDTRYNSIFEGNSDFGGPGVPERTLKVEYRSFGGDDHVGNRGNLVNGALYSLCRGLGLPAPEIDNTRVCWLPEPKEDIPGEWRGVVVLNANCQECSTTKLYPHWQWVVAALPEVRFALIGGSEARDICLPVDGANVLNLRGKTSFGQLFRLVKEARLVLSPSSAVVHIASTYGVPCLCVTGASEPTVLTDYPNVTHISGSCEGNARHYDGKCGCRHFRTTDARSCERTVQIGDRPYARCLSDIPPERVVEAVKRLLGLF